MFLLIQPDVLKVEKCYWYKTDAYIEVGSIIRILFNGRKVRGWVVATSERLPGDLDDTKIKPIIEFVSCGPTQKMVEFSVELAEYYLVSPVVFLRMCSPSVNVVHNVQFGLGPSLSESNKGSKNVVVYVDARENRRELIMENVAKSGSTIIITPESRMRIASFLRENGHKVVVIGIDGKITKDAYLDMRKGNCVVIASRKAIFANVDDLNSIIVLDDGFEQLRDERTPKFHSVDIAKLRAKKDKSDLTVITSVPTVVTHDLNVVDKRTNVSWPQIHIEDLTKTDPTLGLFTHIVTRDIKKAKELGVDVALITNNTSLARKLICSKCQNICTCDNCGHNVMLAENDEQLECEVCKKTRVKICNNCGGINLKKYRKGTKSLTGELEKLFPNAQIVEIDKTKEIDALQLKSSEQKIFIGTESIFHKCDLLKNISLFIFLDFDSYLLRPRADAFEQSLVSTTRAMRVLKKSELHTPILLLTRMPNHEMVIDLLKGDFVSHLTRDLELKKQLGAAPFRATAQIKVKNGDYEDLISDLDKTLIEGFIDEGDWKILGISANNHAELSSKSYKSIRSFASNHRLSLSIDTYE